MAKIRDLGISFIPEARQPEHAGVFAAGKKKPPPCYGVSCEKSQCPTAATGGNKKPAEKKKKTISRNAVEQLHAQMQQKIARMELTK
ncbi:MAG: hypothetical protein DMF56_15410 [Acidobacteria bacterium]|nr:MAG: hypothetical protein DMF56_15410 [Acidobacteriota bacterium]